jgi:hypothetical protein
MVEMVEMRVYGKRDLATRVELHLHTTVRLNLLNRSKLTIRHVKVARWRRELHAVGACEGAVGFSIDRHAV